MWKYENFSSGIGGNIDVLYTEYYIVQWVSFKNAVRTYICKQSYATLLLGQCIYCINDINIVNSANGNIILYKKHKLT